MTAVLWSGGVDSTVLVHKLALQNKANGVTNDPIRAISVINEQVPCQKQQKTAREKLKHWFDAFSLLIECHEVNITAISPDLIGSYDIVEGNSIQPIIWMLGVIGLLKEDEDLHVGYIRGDDIWHKKTELIAVFDNAQKIGGRVGKLKFELEYDTKADTIKAARDFGYLDLCWYCEKPQLETPTPCQECRSCRTHAIGLYGLNLSEASEKKTSEQKPSCLKDVILTDPITNKEAA